MNRVLFIGAHPDDVELGCGGIINKLSEEGCDIRVIMIAEGMSCRYDKCDINSDEVKELIKLRTDCAIKSLNSLGVNSYEFYDLPCGRLDNVSLIDINKIIDGLNSIGNYIDSSETELSNVRTYIEDVEESLSYLQDATEDLRVYLDELTYEVKEEK